LAKTFGASNDRFSFGSIKPSINFPDLLDIQVSSMTDFLQEDVLPEKRKNEGLE